MVIGAETKPLSDEERDQLEAALDRLPPPLEPLDISALDGFLVGVLLQPESLPPSAYETLRGSTRAQFFAVDTNLKLECSALSKKDAPWFTLLESVVHE